MVSVCGESGGESDSGVCAESMRVGDEEKTRCGTVSFSLSLSFSRCVSASVSGGEGELFICVLICVFVCVLI